MTHPLDVLKAARLLLLDPAHWCQTNMAQNKHGGEVDYASSHACRWCLLGAINKSAPDYSGADEAADMLRGQLRLRGHRSNQVSRFNDTHTHADVIDLLEVTITTAENP